MDEAALYFLRKHKPFEHKGCTELHETCAGLDLGEGGFRAVDAANADQGKLILRSQIGLRQHARRERENRPAGQAAPFVRRRVAQ